VLADHQVNPAYAEIKHAIKDIKPDQPEDLVVFMWVGCGDNDIAEWRRTLEPAHDVWNSRATEYLIATLLVAGYL